MNKDTLINKRDEVQIEYTETEQQRNALNERLILLTGQHQAYSNMIDMADSIETEAQAVKAAKRTYVKSGKYSKKGSK